MTEPAADSAPAYQARPLPPIDPAMDASQNHYWNYHGLATLLACKKPVTASQDEDLFIAVHQVCEIAFHQMIIDLQRTLDALRLATAAPADGVIDATDEAAYFLERVLQLWRTVNTTMPVLGDLRAFAEFRTSIGPTSGFQSVQFRHLEILSGVAKVYWTGGTADAQGRPHVAETEFDRRSGTQIAQWLHAHREHSLRHYWQLLLQRAGGGDAAAALRRHPHAGPLAALLARFDQAQRQFHRAHLGLAIVQLRKVGAEVGTGGTSFKTYLARYEREVAPLFAGLGSPPGTDAAPAAP
jgi:tryptophan 2,3-dioxygenase